MVSIITPCYNASFFISGTIESVLAQTYQNWELLIVDDCSTDDSAEVIQKYVNADSRIKYFKTEQPSGGPTGPRNVAIHEANGRYIAFLDSDDVWLPNKLQDQITVFNRSSKNVALVYSNYEKMDEDGCCGKRIIKAPKKVNYKKLLKGNVIACATAMYDRKKVGKCYMKDIKHEDYVLWLSILKKKYVALNTNTIGALYRVRKGSVSSNKRKTLKWQWNIYRNEEEKNVFASLYYFMNYSFKAFLKAIK